MNLFFQEHFGELINSPNQSKIWWHSIPLPDGNRINGYHQDKDLQFKMWRAMKIADSGGLTGKRVLDIGANDGFFTLAALMAGAQEVTAIDMHWGTWPNNIQYVSQIWRGNYQRIPPKHHGFTLGLEACMRSRSGRNAADGKPEQPTACRFTRGW